MTAATHATAPAISGDSVHTASPRDVDTWLRTGSATLIDVREPDEFARERIPGSILLPLSRFDPASVAALARPGKRLVVHCKGGVRSANAASMCQKLRESGIPVFSLAGGIEAWKAESLPVEIDRSRSRMSIMRQVQLVIGLGLLASSAAAWFVSPLWIGIPAFFGAGLTFAGASGHCALATLIGMMPWNRGNSASSCAIPSSK